MGISDFFRKVRTLLEGDPTDDEVYSDAVKPEVARPAAETRSSNAAARLAERMADDYIDPDSPEEDFDDERSGDRFYRSPESSFTYADDEPDDTAGSDYGSYDGGYDEDFDDGFEEGFDSTEQQPAQPAAPVRTDSEPVAVAADGTTAAGRLPSRTEVTLLQIERLSKQLDEDTLRQYQMHLIRHKQETGAVSALTALRILHQYIPAESDSSDGSGDTRIFPDLSAE